MHSQLIMRDGTSVFCGRIIKDTRSNTRTNICSCLLDLAGHPSPPGPKNPMGLCKGGLGERLRHPHGGEHGSDISDEVFLIASLHLDYSEAGESVPVEADCKNGIRLGGSQQGGWGCLGVVWGWGQDGAALVAACAGDGLDFPERKKRDWGSQIWGVAGGIWCLV